MKFAMRLMMMVSLVVVIQPGSGFADTIRNSTEAVVGYSGSFVFDSTLSFTPADRLFGNRVERWTRQDIVAMPIADAQNAVTGTATDVEPDDAFNLMRPDRSSGERIAEAPIEAAAVPEPMSLVLLASGLLPLLRRKWRG